MNNLYLNNNSPIDYTMGSNLVDSMYMGSTMVYSRGGGNPLPKDGKAYIYTKDDRYILPEDVISADTDNVVGLYFGNVEHLILISLFELNPVKIFVNSQSVPDVTTTTNKEDAQQDFNGLLNTIALCLIEDNATDDYQRAFMMCTDEFAVDGRLGYLPGCGELYFLMQNVTTINNAISTVANKLSSAGSRRVVVLIDAHSLYWSSTLYDHGRFWYCEGSPNSGMNSETDEKNVRAFFTPGKYEPDWYGVSFFGVTTTGTRIGNLEMHKTLPIQSKMRGCTITSDGIVKYLDPNNWEKYEDGTDRDFSLNTMVEIPEFYCYVGNYNMNPNIQAASATICISENPNLGWYKFSKCYISAYEGYLDGSVYKSIRTNLLPNSYTEGYHPTASRSLAQFQSYARANGSEHWNAYTYEAHKAMTWLFVVEYANRNSLAGFSSSLTEEGYKQGGLGVGITRSSSLGDYNYNYCPCGYTDGLGNNTGIRDLNGYKANRYRGIENPFGSLYKNVIDICTQSNRVYKCKDYTKFSGSHSTGGDYENLGVINTNSSLLVNIAKTNGVRGELYSSNTSSFTGSNTIYWCDYLYMSSSSTIRTFLIGGYSADESFAGLFCLNSSRGLGHSNDSIGSRLTYLI